MVDILDFRSNLTSTSDNKPYGIHSLCEEVHASLKKCTIVISTLDLGKWRPSWIWCKIWLSSTSENKPYGIHSLCEEFHAALKKCTIVISAFLHFTLENCTHLGILVKSIWENFKFLLEMLWRVHGYIYSNSHFKMFYLFLIYFMHYFFCSIVLLIYWYWILNQHRVS